MNDSMTQKIATLLDQAAQAHHTFEEEELGGEFDANWPHWYAAWLLENGLSSLLVPPPNQNALADNLDALSEQHKQQAGDQSWAEFVAPHLLKSFS